MSDACVVSLRSTHFQYVFVIHQREKKMVNFLMENFPNELSTLRDVKEFVVVVVIVVKKKRIVVITAFCKISR